MAQSARCSGRCAPWWLSGVALVSRGPIVECAREALHLHDMLCNVSFSMDKCAACKALLGEPTSKPAHMDLVLDTNGSGLTAASLQYGKSAEARVLRRWSVG